MNNDQGKLNFGIGLDNASLRADAAESQNIFRSIGRTAEQEGNNIDAAMKKAGLAVAGALTAQQAIEFGRAILNARKEIEGLEISFRTLLGSKEKADQLFGDIRKFAVNTPMQLKDLAAGAQTLLGFNYEADKVMGTLKAIGDISMGDSQKFQSLTLAFAQTSATGKLMGQDLLQMINAGFNPLSVMAEKTGKSIGELKEEMSNGSITAQMVEDAFIAATSSGGKFHGMLEAQSHSIGGALSNLQGAFDDMFNDIGEKGQGVFTDATLTLTEMVKHYQEIGEAIAVLVGIYGTYKAALAATTAIETASLAIKHTEEAAALEQLLSVEQKEQISKMNLSKNSAEYAAVVKREAMANVEAAKAAATKANASMQASLQAAAAAKAEYLQMVALEKEQLKALAIAEASGDTKAIEAAKRDVAAAAILREEAATKMLATQKTAETARTVAATAAETAGTVAKNAETAAAAGDSAAHGILTMAKNAAAAAAAKLNAVIMANPYALAAAAVAALAYGIYKLVTYETDAEKATKELNEATKDCEASIAAEKAKVDILFGTLKGATKGTQEYKDAKQAIINQYGKYLKGLSDEVASLKDVEAAYDAVTAAVERAAKARAMESYTEKATKTYGEKLGEAGGEIRDKLIGKYGNKKGTEYYIKLKPVIEGQKQIKDLSKEMQGVVKSFDKQHVVAMGMGQAYTYTTNAITEGIKNVTDARNVMNDTMKKAADIFGNQGLESKETKTTETPVVKNKKYWEDQKKDLEGQLEAMSSAQLKTEKAKALQKKILEAQKHIDSYNVQKQHSASQTAAQKAQKAQEKQEKQEEQEREKKLNNLARYNDLKRKLELERVRSEKDMEFDTRQAIITAQEDSTEKSLDQLKLNFDRQEEEIKRGYEDLKQAKIQAAKELFEANPANEDKQFDASSVDTTYTEEEIANNEALRKQNLQNYLRGVRETLDAEHQYMKDYLSQYGSFESRKLAITQEYNDKIAKENNEWQKKMLANERDKSIDAAKSQNLLDRVSFETIFSNYGIILATPLQNTLDALQEYTSTPAFKQRSIEDQKSIYEAISNVRQQLAGIQGITFSEVGHALYEYNNALFEYQQTSKELGNLAETVIENETTLRVAEEELAKATDDTARAIAQAAVSTAKTDVTTARSNYARVEQKYREAQANLVSTQNAATASLEGFTASIDKIGNIARSVASGSMKQLWQALGKKTQTKIAEFLTGTASFHEAVDELTKGLTDKGRSLGEFVNSIRNVAEEIAQAGEDIDKGEIGKKIRDMLEGVLGKDGEGIDQLGNKITLIVDKAISNGNSDPKTIGQEVGDAVSKVLQTTSNSGSLWGLIIGLVFDLLDVLAEGIGNLVDVILTKVGDAISGILSEIGSGKFFVAIAEGIANLIAGVIDGIANLVSFGLAGNSLTGWLTGKGSEEKFQETIASWEEKTEANTYALEQLTKAMTDKSKTPEESSKDRDAAISAWNGSMSSLRGSANAIAGESGGGHHSWYYKRNDKKFDYESFNRVLRANGYGEVSNAQGVVNLSADAIQLLRTYAGEAWAAYFGDVDSRQDPNQIKSYLEQLGDLAGKDKEIWSEWYTSLTNISFDSLRDNFKNTLMDMSADADDFADDFEKMMMDSLLDVMMSSSGLSKKLEKWQKKWGNYLASGNTLTSQEVEALRTEYEELVQKGIDLRNQAATITGYGNEDDYSQTASSKGFQAMNQDTGDELNGRFTALQITSEEIREQQTEIRAINEELRNIALLSMGYLETIERNTRELFGMNETLERIEREIKQL